MACEEVVLNIGTLPSGWECLCAGFWVTTGVCAAILIGVVISVILGIVFGDKW